MLNKISKHEKVLLYQICLLTPLDDNIRFSIDHIIKLQS